MTPTEVFNNLSSVRILQRTGKAYVGGQNSKPQNGTTLVTYCDSHSDSDKQHVYTKTNGHGSRLMSELVIQSRGNCAAQAKRNHHANQAYTSCNLPIPRQKPEVYLQANEKQKQNQAKISHCGEDGHCLSGEDVLSETRDSPHDGRTKDNTANDLCNNARLAN